MGFSQKTKGRSWILTVFPKNLEIAGLTKEQIEDPEYVALFLKDRWEKSGKNRKAGVTVCESKTGKYHMHMGCYGNTTTLKYVSRIMMNSHVEPQMGGKEELKGYLLKQGKYEEKGERILFSIGMENIEDKQGKRNDLEEIEDFLEDGLTPEQIFEISFRYRKYEKMIKGHYLSKRIRETPLKKKMWNEYHFGGTGTGKTHTYIQLCEKYSPEEVYLCNDYANSGSSGGGFDFYANNPAKVIVLDEFRGNIPFANFLSLLDVYSRNQQHARYQNVYNLWESVIICSIYPPEEVYRFMVEETKRSTDSIRQMMRRLNKIVYHWKDIKGNYRTYEIPAEEYQSANDMKEKAAKYEAEVPYELEAVSEQISVTPCGSFEF